jgi:hypothetical protein
MDSKGYGMCACSKGLQDLETGSGIARYDSV